MKDVDYIVTMILLGLGLIAVMVAVYAIESGDAPRLEEFIKNWRIKP